MGGRSARGEGPFDASRNTCASVLWRCECAPQMNQPMIETNTIAHRGSLAVNAHIVVRRIYPIPLPLRVVEQTLTPTSLARRKDSQSLNGACRYTVIECFTTEWAWLFWETNNQV